MFLFRVQRSTFVALILSSFLLLGGNRVSAQASHELDSLWGVVGSMKGHDPELLQKKKQKLSDMFGLAMLGDIPSALRVTDSLAETCRLLGDSAAYFEALYRNKASIYQTSSDYRKTFNYLQQYATAVSRIGKNDGYAYVDVGNQYYGVGLADLAREYYMKANEIFTANKNFAGNCTVLDNMGLIWRDKKNADSCVYYFNRSAQIRRDSIHDPYLEAYSYVAAGSALLTVKRYAEAYAYLSKAREILDQPAFEQYKDFVTMRETRINCYRYFALYFLHNENSDSADFYCDKAAQQADLYSIERQRPYILDLKARLALLRKDYPAALAAIREDEAVSIHRNDAWSLVSVYALYIRYYSELNDWKNASLYQDKRFKLNDSLSLVVNDDQMLIMNNALLQFDNDAKIANQQNEIEHKEALMEQSARRNRFMLWGIFALLLIVALVIFFLIQFRKKNKLIEKYNSELEAANQTKEKFLSVISHDLRSPFNTLIGMSNILLLNLKRNDYSQLAMSAEAINESSRKAYVMLDNLMQWVSLQKAHIAVKKERVSLVSLVDEITRLFRNQALTQSITIEKDIRVSVISTDPNMLQVMLRNLLSNAIRHIPTGGKVTLRFEAEGKDAVLTVTDNGNGIEPELLKTLFEKKDGIHIARKGGGLGLELVQEFAEQLGGTISAANLPEGGACFTIRLFDAAPGGEGASESQEETDELKLSASDRRQLSALVKAMRQHEIFDTTELRGLVGEEEQAGDSKAMAEWRSRVRQAIYHSDAQQLERLFALVETAA